MPRRVGSYDHLGTVVQMPLDLDKLAETLEKRNYGTQRFLSALVRERRKSSNYKEYEEYCEHTEQLAKLVDSGFY